MNDLIKDLGHLDSTNIKAIRSYSNFVQNRIVKLSKMGCVIPQWLVAFFLNGLGSKFNLKIFQLRLRANIEKRELPLDEIVVLLVSHDTTNTKKDTR